MNYDDIIAVLKANAVPQMPDGVAYVIRAPFGYKIPPEIVHATAINEGFTPDEAKQLAENGITYSKGGM